MSEGVEVHTISPKLQHVNPGNRLGGKQKIRAATCMPVPLDSVASQLFPLPGSCQWLEADLSPWAAVQPLTYFTAVVWSR